MKHDHLKRAPVIEALLEIQVPLGVDYGFVPGALAERLKDEFPGTERIFQFGNISLPPLLVPNVIDVRLRSQDGRLIQCGPQVVTVNMVAPYPGFDVFRKTMHRALNVFYEIARPQQPRRMSLRYINLIAPQFLEGTHINVDAVFPSAVLPQKKAFTIRAVFPFSRPEGELAIATNYPHSLGEGTTGFLLDLDFYRENPGGVTPEEILVWADQAHDKIYDVFDACVGKATIDRFR